MNDHGDAEFNRLLADAATVEFSGWDFARFDGRWREAAPSWDYTSLVRSRIAGVTALLDMDTGGGEFLASLAPLPSFTVATENHPPNIPVARTRLEPLGVQVVSPTDEAPLPFANATFDLVHNRHGAFLGSEVMRVLQPGGRFITQQVGGGNCARLNDVLHAPPMAFADHSLEHTIDELRAAGLHIERTEEEFPDSIFMDVGMVVIYLRIISWQIPDFDVARYRPQLHALHRQIQREGDFNARAHRFLIEARKPA